MFYFQNFISIKNETLLKMKRIPLKRRKRSEGSKQLKINTPFCYKARAGQIPGSNLS
jgi:hypothetical protein